MYKKEDVGTGSGKTAYTIVPDYRERPESFSVVESPPDRILKRLNNGQPPEVKEAAEKLREYGASLYNGQGGRTPELQYLTGRLCRRMRAIYPRMPHSKLLDMAEDVTSQIVSAGYIEALEQLSSKNAQTELGYIKDVAESVKTSWPNVLMFGVRVAGNPHTYSYLGGTDRALAAYITKEKLRGIHRPGLKGQKTYKQRFSLEENRLAYEAAERMVQPWPVRIDEHRNLTEVEIASEKRKLPADFESARREYYKASTRGKPRTLGFKRLPGDRSYEMVEDMASITK